MAAQRLVSVAVRVRPTPGNEGSVCLTVSGDKEIRIDNDKLFTLNKVFNTNATQEDIFNETSKMYLERLFNGHSNTIMAYGQTGSGKTFTIGTEFPEDAMPEDFGLIPRYAEAIFRKISTLKETSCSVKVTFLEVYNNDVYDLLASSEVQKKITVRQEGNNFKVFGLSQFTANNKEDVLQYLRKGCLARKCSATKMNLSSSRSHAIFTLALTINDGYVKFAKLNLIDLAGSEAASKSDGQEFKNGVDINMGLFTLRKVISALKTKGLAPYREHVLTKLLKDSLDTFSRVLLIACFSPATANKNESINTLRLVADASQIKTLNSNSSFNFTTPRMTPNTWRNKRIQSQNVIVPETPDIPLNKVLTYDEPPRMSSPNDNFRTIGFESAIKKYEAPDLSVICPKTPRRTFRGMENDIQNFLENADRTARRESSSLATRRRTKLKDMLSLIQDINQTFAIDETTIVNGVNNLNETTILADLSSNSDNTVVQFENHAVVQAPKMVQNRRSMRLSAKRTSEIENEVPTVRSKRRRTTRISYAPQLYGFEEDSVVSQKAPTKAAKRKANRTLEMTMHEVKHRGDKTTATLTQEKNNRIVLQLLNKGSMKDIQLLPCIGAKTAYIIVTYREIHGLFESVEDLQEIRGLAKTFYTRFSKANMLA